MIFYLKYVKNNFYEKYSQGNDEYNYNYSDLYTNDNNNISESDVVNDENDEIYKYNYSDLYINDNSKSITINNIASESIILNNNDVVSPNNLIIDRPWGEESNITNFNNLYAYTLNYDQSFKKDVPIPENSFCSKSCCSKQYGISVEDPSLGEGLYASTGESCNNSFQNAGCLCVKKI